MYKGVELVNATPHPIMFIDEEGKEFVVPPSGYKLNARGEEREAQKVGEIEIVETAFRPSEDGLEELKEIEEKQDSEYLIIVSAISLQAYKSFSQRVVMMTPAPGYERVPPSEKRMNPKKFSR